MAKLTPYQVHVRDIPVHRHFVVPAEDVGAWVAGLPMRDALGAPTPDPDAGHGEADLELYADGDHVFASGTFEGYLHVACSRCVEPVKLVIDERLMITFMPRAQMPADHDEVQAKPGKPGEEDEGVEVETEDLDLFPYDGDIVDLEPLFREQFVLAIPYAPLCKEDCKGLCPQCGIDRNSATCRCEPPIDPRLAPLKGLKIPS